MSRSPISKEKILEGAYTTARTYGLSAISIRGIAQECGVSIGTIYNYFPSRDELVAATAALLFSEAFYEGFCHPRPDENFLGYCERLYQALDDRLSITGSDWLTQFQGLNPSAREVGRKHMDELLDHVRNGLESVLSRDAGVSPDALTDDFDAEDVCRFTLDVMFDALRRGDHDCRTLLVLLERALY